MARNEFVGEIAEALRFMMLHYPGQELSRENLEVYLEALAGMNIVRLRAAIERLVRENRFPPRPAEIIEAAASFNSVRIEPLRDRMQQIRQMLWRDEDAASQADELYRELRAAGYWEMAAYLRSLQDRVNAERRDYSMAGETR